MTTSVPSPLRYCPAVTAPASASIAACRVVCPVPPLAIATVPVTFPAVVADVADVAVLAFPFSAAVMVPAEKSPDASRATTVDGLLRFVALDVTVKVALPV